MKPSRELFLERKQSRRLGVDAREASRKPRGREARPTPWARPPPSWGPRGSPNRLLSPIYIYPYTLKRSGNRIDREFRRRKPLQPPKTNRDPVSAPCRRGEPSAVAIFIIPSLSMTRREQFTLGAEGMYQQLCV